jgi:hypothetical protein
VCYRLVHTHGLTVPAVRCLLSAIWCLLSVVQHGRCNRKRTLVIVRVMVMVIVIMIVIVIVYGGLWCESPGGGDAATMCSHVGEHTCRQGDTPTVCSEVA